MANILDFLDWFGDITLEQVPFCEADALVLAQLSYVRLEGIIPSIETDDTITVAEASQKFRQLNRKDRIYEKNGFVSPLSPFVLFKMAEGRRWKDKRLSHIDHRMVPEIHEQFTAMCIEVDEETHFLAFRGTDDTIAGWKEDFMMTFTEVPAQKDAARYCDELATRLDGRIMLGGHSKGGNLAAYALACSKPETQERIDKVWCMDSPGFSSQVLPQSRFNSISSKIALFIPQFCMVGELMNQSTSSTIIKSCEKGAFQHDALSWQIKGTKLVRAGVQDPNSVKLINTANHFIRVRNQEERMRVTNAFFSVFSDAGIESLNDFSKFDPVRIKNFIKGITKIDSKETAAIAQIITTVLTCSISSSINSLGGFLKIGERLDAIADKQEAPVSLDDYEIWNDTKTLRNIRSNVQKVINATPFAGHKNKKDKELPPNTEDDLK